MDSDLAIFLLDMVRSCLLDQGIVCMRGIVFVVCVGAPMRMRCLCARAFSCFVCVENEEVSLFIGNR